MTTVCPSGMRIRSPMIRAAVSVDPPGGNGTTRLIGRAGKVCACAPAKPAASATATANFLIPPPPLECMRKRISHADAARFFPQAQVHKLPVSIKEYLTLLEAMQKGVIGPSIDDFYYLSRATLVKDEANFDKFDRAFSEFWRGVETIPGIDAQIPLEWLLKQAELNLTDEEKKMIEALGGWEKLMETLKKRLEEQKGRHQGGSKWIGTGGTSPFGAYGYNPEGLRMGPDQ